MHNRLHAVGDEAAPFTAGLGEHLAVEQLKRLVITNRRPLSFFAMAFVLTSCLLHPVDAYHHLLNIVGIPQ